MRLSKVVVSSSILVLMLCSILIIGCNSNGGSSNSSNSSSSPKIKDDYNVPNEIKDQIAKTIESKKMSGQIDMFDLVSIRISSFDEISNVRKKVEASYKVKIKKSPEEVLNIIKNDLSGCKKLNSKEKRTCFQDVHRKYQYALTTMSPMSIYAGDVSKDNIEKFIVGEEVGSYVSGIWLKTDKGWELTKED